MSELSSIIVVGDHFLEVVGDYSPATPDVFYLPNGDPGYPGDPEDFTVNEIWLLDDKKKRLVRIDSLVEAFDTDGGTPPTELVWELVLAEINSREPEFQEPDDSPPVHDLYTPPEGF